jgi:hypothetical protein
VKDGGEKPADPPQHAMVFGVLLGVGRWRRLHRGFKAGGLG